MLKESPTLSSGARIPMHETDHVKDWTALSGLVKM